MSIDIDPAGLCQKDREAHEQLEFNLNKKMPVEVGELCDKCKEKFGFKKPVPAIPAEGEDTMKKKRKYTRKADKVTLSAGIAFVGGKAPKLDKDTKRIIKTLKKSGKKADKLEAKAEKWQAKADDYRAEAAAIRANRDALKAAVKAAVEDVA